MFADPNAETREDIRDRILRVIASELFRNGSVMGLTDKIRETVDRGTLDCVRIGLRGRLRKESDEEITNPYGYEPKDLEKAKR